MSLSESNPFSHICTLALDALLEHVFGHFSAHSLACVGPAIDKKFTGWHCEHKSEDFAAELPSEASEHSWGGLRARLSVLDLGLLVVGQGVDAVSWVFEGLHEEVAHWVTHLFTQEGWMAITGEDQPSSHLIEIGTDKLSTILVCLENLSLVE